MKWCMTILFLWWMGTKAHEWQDTVRFNEVTKVFVQQKEEAFDTLSQQKISLQSQKSIDQLLDREPGFFMKRYGNGMLSSISYRGTNAAQSSLEWNGVAIQSPNTGQNDLSIISMLSERQKIILNKSTQIGASINILPEFLEKNEVAANVSYTYNTLQSHTIGINFSMRKNWLAFTTDFFSLQSKNQYKYAHPFEKNKLLTLTNAAVAQFSIQHQMRLFLPKNNQVDVAFWWANSDRQLPNFNPNINTKERQNDDSYRVLLSYFGQKNSLIWQLNTSYIEDQLFYSNNFLAVESNTKSQVSRNKITIKNLWPKKRLSLSSNLSYDYESSLSSGFESKIKRHIGKWTQQLSFKPTKWSSSIDFEQILWNKKVIPAGKLFVSYTHSKKDVILSYTASAAKTYRLPSLNDLYWAQGGNSSLTPENGWKYEASFHLYQKYVNTKLIFYGQHINDWILWQPDQNVNYWTPSNLKKVMGYGVEYSLTTGILPNTKSFAAFIDAIYSFSKIENQKAINNTDASVGKQLIYTPLHKATMNAVGQYKGFELTFETQFVGKVFTATDNSESLNPYWILNTSISKHFTFNKHKLAIMASLYNIANQTFYSVPLKPLPGRYFEISVKLNLLG
jgi:vitamin B12 transporter